jgi:hypothetical protein
MWLGPLAGVVLAAALLVAQMRATGTTSYYLFKYLMGLELILAAVASALCGMLLSSVGRRVERRAIGVTLAISATVVATQAFGPFPSADPLMLSETDGGTAGIQSPYSREAIARGVISAARASSPLRSLRQEYLPLGAGRAAQAYYPDAWFHAINVSLTEETGARINALRVPMRGVDDALPTLRELLTEDGELEVVVDPRYVASLRHRLAKPELSSRVVPWTVEHTSCGQSSPRENADSRSCWE